MSLCELLFLASLALAAMYALAILLRLACYSVGIDIPALGRACGVSTIVAGGSLLAGLLIQIGLVGGPRFEPMLQFLAFVLMLMVNLALSVSAFVWLLNLSPGRAFNLWLVQTVLFLASLGFFSVVGMLFGLL